MGIRYDIELVKWQQKVKNNSEKYIVIFEGRDCSGKSSCIRYLMRYMPTKDVKVIALDIPSIEDTNNWYWTRFINQFPKPGQITFWDRSWYNRAMIEPIMGFCTREQTEQFYNEVNTLEQFWIDSNINIIKFYFSVSPEKQKQRFNDRLNNVLKHNKLSDMDRANILLYDEFTIYEKQMLERTNNWHVLNGDNKNKVRKKVIEIITKI